MHFYGETIVALTSCWPLTHKRVKSAGLYAKLPLISLVLSVCRAFGMQAVLRLAEVKEGDLLAPQHIITAAGGMRLVSIAVRVQLGSDDPEDKLLACRAFTTLFRADDDVKAQMGINPQASRISAGRMSFSCLGRHWGHAQRRWKTMFAMAPAFFINGRCIGAHHTMTGCNAAITASVNLRPRQHLHWKGAAPADAMVATNRAQVVKNVVTPEQATQLLADVSEADLLSRHHILSNANKHPDKGFETVVPAIFRALNAPPVPGAPAVDERKKAVRRRLAARALRTLAKEGPAMQAKLLAAGLAARLADSTPQVRCALLSFARHLNAVHCGNFL